MTNVPGGYVVSPQCDSRAGDCGQFPEDAVCGVCAENADDRLVGDDMDMEHGNVAMRTISAPSPPSKQEALEHAVTHPPLQIVVPILRYGQIESSATSGQTRGRS